MVSLTSAPTSEYDSPQGEADGHAYVQLTGTGQSVSGCRVIPDRQGGGMTSTLDLYVNGTFRQALPGKLDSVLAV